MQPPWVKLSARHMSWRGQMWDSRFGSHGRFDRQMLPKSWVCCLSLSFVHTVINFNQSTLTSRCITVILSFAKTTLRGGLSLDGKTLMLSSSPFASLKARCETQRFSTKCKDLCCFKHLCSRSSASYISYLSTHSVLWELSFAYGNIVVCCLLYYILAWNCLRWEKCICNDWHPWL